LYWRARWGLAKVLFFWNRYISIIVLGINLTVFVTKGISNSLCEGWFVFEGMTGFFSVVVADLIMLERVHILYERRRSVLWFLIALFIADTGAALTLAGLGLAIPPASAVLSLEEEARLNLLVSGCYPSAYPRVLAAWSFPPVITALVLFLMTLRKCAWSFKLFDRRAQAPIFALFLDHGAVYFLCILATTVSNAFVWYFARASIAGVGICLAISILSVTGSRLLLDLKCFGASLSGDSRTRAELSTMRVANHVSTTRSSITSADVDEVYTSETWYEMRSSHSRSVSASKTLTGEEQRQSLEDGIFRVI